MGFMKNVYTDAMIKVEKAYKEAKNNLNGCQDIVINEYTFTIWEEGMCWLSVGSELNITTSKEEAIEWVGDVLLAQILKE